GGINGTLNYDAPSIRSEVKRVHTNTSCSANYRAPSYPQGYFAIESAMDEIAERVKMDPAEFRLKISIKLYRNETQLSSNGLAECLRQGAEAFGWAEKRKEYAAGQQGEVRRGVGMAICHFDSGLGPSSAALKIYPDGSVKLFVGVTDIGTG